MVTEHGVVELPVDETPGGVSQFCGQIGADGVGVLVYQYLVSGLFLEACVDLDNMALLLGVAPLSLLLVRQRLNEDSDLVFEGELVLQYGEGGPDFQL